MNESSFTELTTVVAPPATPYLGDGSWDGLVEELGTALPAEYVALMKRYGGGSWLHFLYFYTPLRINRFLNRARNFAKGYVYQQELVIDAGATPMQVWPEPGGFLPFANDANAGTLGWVMTGPPDEWPLLLVSREHWDFPLPGGLVDTLLDWARGGRPVSEFPVLGGDDDLVQEAVFTPWDAGAAW
ncbi:SMI1/KNR4 family protein [Actinoplanes sp. NPDC051470]|uniref:SMI1/KNR4 family protein n=1 Tax=unclassified Actinoplanes TaxID=2626549 RepID=UPI00344AAD79